MGANNLTTHGSLSKIDFYRRVPRDLTEATSLGATMSIIAMTLMGVLFISESLAFARNDVATSIALDANDQPQIRINFNITMLDLHCDYAVVDVLDVLGTNRQNITKNVDRWQLDSNLNRRVYSGKNKEQREVVHEEHSDEILEELENAEEVHAVQLEDEEHYSEFLKQNEMAFIDFYAPWCVWCQRLHPTWELFAKEVKKQEIPFGVAMVDCVEQAELCRKANIRAFPTLRWFHMGEAMFPGTHLLFE